MLYKYYIACEVVILDISGDCIISIKLSSKNQTTIVIDFTASELILVVFLATVSRVKKYSVFI